MLPFTVEFRPGRPVHRQVVYAVTKAVVSGQLTVGDSFPSVRVLSQDLKINPNTAHKIVSTLVNEGLLEVRPGIGTVVAAVPPGSAAQRSHLMKNEIERLVVESKRLSLNLEDVLDAVRKHWDNTRPRTSRRSR
jgi:GntR family transcriptional regulator